MKANPIFIFVFLLSLLTSCATIIKGSKQEITILSYPTNANVYVNNVNIGQTPMSIKVPRRKSYIVSIEKENYEIYQTAIQKRFNGWIIGNLVFGFGGLPGLGIDLLSGASNSLYPNTIDARLNQKFYLSANDSAGVLNLINAGMVYEMGQINALPQISDKNALVNLFQKSEKNNFTISFIVNANGEIDPGSFHSDDRYIEKIKHQLSQELKFNPGKKLVNGSLYNVRTKLNFVFNLSTTEKIESQNASFDVEKSFKRGELLYTLSKLPKNYSEDQLFNIINLDAILAPEEPGMFTFAISQYKTKGTIFIKGNDKPYDDFQSTLIKFKYIKYE